MELDAWIRPETPDVRDHGLVLRTVVYWYFVFILKIGKYVHGESFIQNYGKNSFS